MKTPGTEFHKARRSRKPEQGFSLFELLVVLAILALIIGLVAPRVIGYLGRSKTQTASIQLEYIHAALDLFLLDIGRYPTEEEGLKVLVKNEPGLDGWNGPYLKSKTVPEDPWGRPFRYRLDDGGQTPVVYSLGADNQEGGEGENRDIGLNTAGPPTG
ncbi:MAG: type II secretion system major pseudopilin GspG [Alphaproteobacteria bacterium]